MAKQVKALKEQAKEKAPESLKKEAQELISEALAAAAARQGVGDNQVFAERLLSQLEPIVSKYAPPPERVMRILRDQGMLRPSTFKVESQAGPKVVKLSKDVYSDKGGSRLARRHLKGWRKVKY